MLYSLFGPLKCCCEQKLGIFLKRYKWYKDVIYPFFWNLITYPPEN